LSQPDGSDRRELAVPAGRLARSEPPDAAYRRLRRGDERAAAAESAAADQIRVLRQNTDEDAEENRGRRGSNPGERRERREISPVLASASRARRPPAPPPLPKRLRATSMR